MRHKTVAAIFLCLFILAAIAAPVMPFNAHSTTHVFQKVRPVPFMVMLAHDHQAERAGRIASPVLPA